MNGQYIGNLAGVVGVTICLVSIFSRFIGEMVLVQFQAINVFIVGVGFMVFGCFCKLSGR
jgi:hypothetical protein